MAALLTQCHLSLLSYLLVWQSTGYLIGLSSTADWASAAISCLDTPSLWSRRFLLYVSWQAGNLQCSVHLQLDGLMMQRQNLDFSPIYTNTLVKYQIWRRSNGPDNPVTWHVDVSQLVQLQTLICAKPSFADFICKTEDLSLLEAEVLFTRPVHKLMVSGYTADQWCHSGPNRIWGDRTNVFPNVPFPILAAFTSVWRWYSVTLVQTK